MKKIIQIIFLYFAIIQSAVSGGTTVTVAASFGSSQEAELACHAYGAQFGFVDYCGPRPTFWYLGGVCSEGPGGCDGVEDYVLQEAYYYFPVYSLAEAYFKNQNSCTVGNPIDPVSGKKIHQESLIQLNATQPLNLELFYNSAGLDKWKHNYSRQLTFSSGPTGNRYDTNGSANGFNPVAVAESSSFLGGEVTAFGKKNMAPEDTAFYLTKEQACETGWSNFKVNYKYAWVNNSVAEYRLTPISTFGAVGQCYILDAVGGNVKMVLDIIELFEGTPEGYASLPLPTSNYTRFIRETGEVIVFSEVQGFKNLSNSGDTLEKVNVLGATLYRLHTTIDEVEEYEATTGRLLSITSAQGNVQTFTYDPASGLLNQVSNQTGESITFAYETYGDTNQYYRIKTITDHSPLCQDSCRLVLFTYNKIMAVRRLI